MIKDSANEDPEVSTASAPKSASSSEITETEKHVNEAISNLEVGRDGDETYYTLFKAWRSFQRSPEQLRHIQNEGQFGMALLIFLSYGIVSDIDDKQQLVSISYLFLSRAIEKNSADMDLVKNRILLIIMNHEPFEYTVSSALNHRGGFDMFSMIIDPFKARDAMYKMEFADLLKSPVFLSVDMLRQKYLDLDNKIANGFFGLKETNQTIRDTGIDLHKKVSAYLNNKVFTEEDIDF